MVAGSDKLLSDTANGDNRVTLQVIIDELNNYNDIKSTRKTSC